MEHLMGKAINGKAIHFLKGEKQVPDDGYGFARCDKRLIVEIVKDATIQDITCSACKRYSDYKEATAQPMQPKGDEKTDATDPTATELPTEATQPLPDQIEEPQEPLTLPELPRQEPGQPMLPDTIYPVPEFTPQYYVDQMKQIFEETKSVLNTLKTELAEIKRSIKKLQPGSVPAETAEVRYKKLSEEIDQFEKLREGSKTEAVIYDKEEDHFKVVSNGKTMSIRHLPSGKHVFKGLEPQVAERALGKLNRLKLKWTDPLRPVPKDFITKMVAALDSATAEVNSATTETGKRKLKRRSKATKEIAAKPQPKRIKRRKKT